MAATKKAEDVVNVDVYTAKGLLSTNHHYLDVRTVEEFNKSHVNGALNVPYMFITQEGCNSACNSGGRSLRASVDLLNAGFEHVSNMEGGYSKWVDSGLAGDKPGEELKTACKFRP
ncbi:Rhodanese-like domain containing protein [Parasponia andersonii]|uniref:Rhodanese-like domain containing protein n=1 Tax=Parasponia andersonii TaxID=3476 RepID=A0A2P5AI79_PARAD|nr:Rhodanese-like domain containing protein [Parasponia andersonii]